MEEQIQIQASQLCKFLLIVAPELVDDRFLAMDHLIMRKRKKVVILIKVTHGEQKAIGHGRALSKRGSKVIQSIVHPSQIPFVVKSQSAINNGCGHFWVITGIFRNQHDFGVFLPQVIIDTAQKPKAGII